MSLSPPLLGQASPYRDAAVGPCQTRDSFKQSTLELNLLAQRVYPRPPISLSPPSSQPSSVIITGATGFLGIHLLMELTTQYPAIKVFCIARNPSKAEQMIHRFSRSPFPIHQIRWIQGDLTTLSPQALPPSDFVIHSAARMHGLLPLRHLWADNVDATLRLLDYCSASGAMMLFASSLSVFVSSNLHGDHHPLPLPIDDQTLLYGGYAQSKYVCEDILLSANGMIARLGLLTGASTTGIFPESVFFVQFIKALHHLGIHPKNYEEAWVDITPVDFAAQHLIQTVFNPSPIQHIANRDSLSLTLILEALNTRPVSSEEFFLALATLPKIERVLLHYAFLKTDALQKYPQYFNIDLFQSTSHQYHIKHPFPVSNPTLLQLYLKGILKNVL